ncbi:MAG: DUF3135 domain-containing protein [Chromatiaceae bacterium]|nr:DUF3135 domain-containing protein [Gammaproteobacteria bacterium]MCP5300717.1 DUF3135 domain-containing protein [Chromatiaceae bacterium]MCP5422789.1 DUF3135 domain-containing protein [Chromatiaceae bacterium]
MDNKNTAEIDFDTWAEVARTDPAAFEAMRLKAIEDVIESAPEHNRERLRRLQWRIDQERRLARTPIAACMRISRMMWRAVLGPNGLNERFGELQRMFHGQADAAPAEPQPCADVLLFARAND